MEADGDVDLLLSLLLVDFDAGNIDEESILLFLLVLEEKGARLPQFIPSQRICLRGLSDDTCERHFRFTNAELRRLCAVLRFPETMRSPGRVSWTGMEGLLIMLRRLVFPNRLGELVDEFGRSRFALSIIFNCTLTWMWQTWGHLLTDPFTRPYFSADRVRAYSAAVKDKSGVDLNVWGFIDGTLRATCRPIHHQRIFYNGHKRHHGVKYQAVTAPDGLITHLYGPVEGCRHDAGVLQESRLLHQLQQHLVLPGGEIHSLYGDPAYPLTPLIMKGYQGAHLTPQQQVYNTSMSQVRMAVEWSFGDVTTYWAYIDCKKENKLLLQPIGLYYRVAVLMTNCRVILSDGNKTSKYFKIKPPTLEEYFQ